VAEHRIKCFKCVVCGKEIVQKYVISCPARKYCSEKCRWTFENAKRSNKGQLGTEYVEAKKPISKKEYNKEYYRLNRNSEIERAKKYQKENRERMTAISKERRHNNILEQEKNKTRAREWYCNNKKRFYEYKDNYKKANMDKIIAQKEARKAIAKKELIRKPCEICGNTKTDAHHDDYSKPLEVRWLCRAHHKEWHMTNKPARGQI